MKTFVNPPENTWCSLCKRPVFDAAEIESRVREILLKVKYEGDKALQYYSEKFDGVTLSDLKVSDEEISSSEREIPDTLKNSLEIARKNIEKFHKPQLTTEPAVETSPGIICWRKNSPVEKVGLYVPGGSAPLFSTVLMLAVPAKIAGCEKIILCTPPGKDGKINPIILYTASLVGVTDVFKVGGAQAIAAMAYGTETIPAVYKIFGPGNQYVTKAKELVQTDGVPVDMPAGPSEVLVIADKTADPSFVAADLLSQAEHGSDSQVILATTSSRLISVVQGEIEAQVRDLPRKEIALKALENSFSVQFSTLEECIAFSNSYSPEHLIISTADPGILAMKVKNAGSVFLGKYSCESGGDYATGTNHTLPTNGNSRKFSGVSVDSFVKKITFQEVSAMGLTILGPVIEQLAEAEFLAGHRNAVSVRLKSISHV